MRWCPAVAFNNVGNAPVCYSFIRPNYTAGGQAISNSTPYRLTQISRAADLMLMLDAIDVKGTEYIGGNGDSFTTAVQPICVNSVSSQIRHSGGVNALFADFHVQYIQWSDLDATTPQGLANRNLWTSLQ
jgi:prepilin-type processing-associated H-X9-DG protein